MVGTWSVGDFDLDAIAASGQAFTWTRLGSGDYIIASGDRRCRATQDVSTLALSDVRGGALGPEELDLWHHYLALDQDYDAILSELALPREVAEASRGIRVLAQDWWDTSVSFIISQNSTIVRIQRTMDALMNAGGGVVPRPADLARLLADDAFRSDLRLGYREPYLVDFAARCSAGWEPLAAEHKNVTLCEAMNDLERCRGIGPKVAQCICLFSLGYLEAVPRDTWIKRAEREHDISWHPRWGGIQQQYVFKWMRDAGKPRQGSTS